MKSRSLLKLSLLLIAHLLIYPIYGMQTNRPKVELIVVFKKDVSLKQAQEVLSVLNVSYKKGIDSSRGKSYYYSTGPKFIVQFLNTSLKNQFVQDLKKYQNRVHEYYEPNWMIKKD